MHRLPFPFNSKGIWELHRQDPKCTDAETFLEQIPHPLGVIFANTWSTVVSSTPLAIIRQPVLSELDLKVVSLYLVNHATRKGSRPNEIRVKKVG
jgi:hypothetical protein